MKTVLNRRGNLSKALHLVCNIACIVVVMCTFNACRTSKNAAEKTIQNELLQKERMYALTQPADGMTDLTAKISLDLDYNSRPLSLKGRLRMRYDEVIQVSFTALGLMEVATLEIRPDVVYIVDRVNKRYVKVSYTSDMLSRAGVNFSTIQALFWNRLYVPGGKSGVDVRDAFSIYESDKQQVLRPKEQGFVKHHFYTDEAISRLEQTQLSVSFYEALWRYDMFSDVDGYNVPTVHDLSFTGGNASVGAHVVLSGVSCTDKSWKAGVDLSRYQQVDFDELLSVLGAW